MVDEKGYRYNIHTRNDSENIGIWRCKRKEATKGYDKCLARAWTSGSKIIKFCGEHNHPPNPQTFLEIEMQADPFEPVMPSVMKF